MIKAGCIGTGGISGVHLRYLQTRGDVEIAALCDVNAENLERARKQYGGRGFADFREMLKSEKLDAVWICTPPQVRREPLLACADRGIPVFCEKPVERDLARARSIARELKKRKARVQIGYVFRSMPIVQRLRKEMAGDRIHGIQSFYGCGVSLNRSLPAWFYDKALSGGALVDQATHNLDLLRMLMGEVATVSGIAANPVHPKKKGYTVDEVLALSLLFENGTAGGHVHTWVGDGWRNEMLLIGEKRVYRMDLGRGVLTVEEGSDTRTCRQDQSRIYEHQNRRFLEMVVAGGWDRNPSTYEDAVRTLALTLLCDKAVTAAGARTRRLTPAGGKLDLPA